jgi:hypothetical protein
MLSVQTERARRVAAQLPLGLRLRPKKRPRCAIPKRCAARRVCARRRGDVPDVVEEASGAEGGSSGGSSRSTSSDAVFGSSGSSSCSTSTSDSTTPSEPGSVVEYVAHARVIHRSVGIHDTIYSPTGSASCLHCKLKIMKGAERFHCCPNLRLQFPRSLHAACAVSYAKAMGGDFLANSINFLRGGRDVAPGLSALEARTLACLLDDEG